MIIPHSHSKSFNNKKNNENFILTLYEKFIDIYLLNSLSIYHEKTILSKDQRLFVDKKTNSILQFSLKANIYISESCAGQKTSV